MPEKQPISHQFDRNAQARSQGEAFGIPKNEGESDDQYRERLSGVLRSQGRIIEAHEVYSGRRFDDPEQGEHGPLLGIFGAVALEHQGIRFHHNNPSNQVGDDIAAGIITQADEDPARQTIRRTLELLGPTTGMDLLDAMTRSSKK